MKLQRQRPCTERSAEDNSLGRENTLLPSWKNCIGCQWNSELITKPCPWLTNAYEGTAPEYLQELIPRYVHARPLLSSSQPRLLIPSAAEKHAKSSLVSEPFPTLLPSSGIETSYKARHHQQQQQKATKQSISLRQPSTTPCSHGSWNRLNWDGVCVCVWVCVGGGGGGGLQTPITPTHPASWWWREGLHTSSPSESVIFSNRL